MKKQVVLVIAVIMYLIQSTVGVMAVSDREILSDPVANVYKANYVGQNITKNIDFKDVANGYWAKEPITRLGALEVVKGYNEGNTASYRPGQSVSKQEALAFLLRVIGQEATALAAAENIATNEDDPILSIWSRGYLQVAANLGIITNAELVDALTLDQTVLDPEFNFIRDEVVTREQIAKWLVEVVNVVRPDALVPVYEPQVVHNMNDWETIGLEFLPFVEVLMQEDIMVGTGNSFDPQGPVTRAQMAQIIVNIDELLFETMGLQLKGGVVGHISDSALLGPLGSDTKRKILIRNDKGLVDQVELLFRMNELGDVAAKDVPVFGPNGVKGLGSLKEGDYVTYIVDDINGEIKYVYSRGIEAPIKVIGVLQPFNGFGDGDITIENESGMQFTYKMVDGLYDVEGNTIKLSYVNYPLSSAPVSNTVTLTLKNNLVTLIEYEGALPQSMEVSGIVKEVNPTLGFMTIESWDGRELTKFFRPGDVIVEKQNYYDSEDEIGYIDEVFPDYRFDERDSNVEALDVGDIVHILLDPSNLQYAKKISAKTNYTVKFGELKTISDKGAQGSTIRIVYQDGTIGTLDVPAQVPVMKSGTNVTTRNLEVGDMIKVLMNQAVLAPGQTIESVKHIEVDAYGNIFSKVYKGKLGNYDKNQKTLDVLNSYELSRGGWTDYNQVASLDVPSNGYEVYYGGKRISMDYAENYLRTYDMKLYVVTESHFDQEQVAKVIFDDGRGEVLNPSNIIYSNGYDTMRMVSQSDQIDMDEGTIVIKNDHIVSTASILSPDFAQVVVGDQGDAIVVNIMPEPNNDAVSVMRGRIADIETGQVVKVTSHAVLKDMTWIYSPIEREYTMSYDTRIVEEDGLVPLSEFIDYTEASKVDEVYTIIAEGTKATHLVKNPYATEGVVGEVYEIGDDGTVKLRDALVYDSETKLWEELSYKNNYADVLTDDTTIVIKNNQVVRVSDLEFGDQVRSMITIDLAEQIKLEGDRTAQGYILFVEE